MDSEPPSVASRVNLATPAVIATGVILAAGAIFAGVTLDAGPSSDAVQGPIHASTDSESRRAQIARLARDTDISPELVALLQGLQEDLYAQERAQQQLQAQLAELQREALPLVTALAEDTDPPAGAPMETVADAEPLPLSIVARDLRADHDVATLVVSWDDLESAEAAALYEQRRGGHADEGETSIILHLRPELVHLELAVQAYRAEPKPQIGYRPGKFDRDSEPGIFGDPTLASAEKGEQLLTLMRRNWLQALTQFESL